MTKGILLPFVGKLEDAASSSPTDCYHVRQATLELAGPLWARPRATFLAQVVFTCIVHLSAGVSRHAAG